MDSCDLIVFEWWIRGSCFVRELLSQIDHDPAHNHRLWQDVYHVPSPAGVLYVKFTADAVTEFLLLSFKEKSHD
jgi:hypothetical protein